MMTPEQMHQVTLFFAVALNEMKAAADSGEPVTLTAEKNSAVVHMIRLLGNGGK
jgi:hypothetical protein